MRIEKLSKGKNKKIVLSILIIVLIVGAIYITNSKAKYQVTQSVQIVNGKVNYSLADFNLMAVYLQDMDEDGIGKENSYQKAKDGRIPTNGYKLREVGVGEYDTHCTVGAENVEDITITYKDGKVDFSGVTTQGTKCYLYFDIENIGNPDETLAKLGISASKGTISTVTGPSCSGTTGGVCYSSGNQNNNMNQNGIYDAEDDYGTSYV